MVLVVDQNHQKSFSDWLANQKYQNNTIRNYLLDVRYFLNTSNNLLSETTIAKFIASDAGQNNHSRHLASISKFCQFAVDQKLIDTNFYTRAKKSTHSPNPNNDMDALINNFIQSLRRQHKSTETIRNYLGDIRQYISFCESKTL